MRRILARVALLVVATALSARAGASDWVTDLPPNVATDLTVSGTCRMGQDVTVAAGATLRFRPGTRVEVSMHDAGKGGNLPDSCEFLVHGRIAVDGTAEAPVVFDAVSRGGSAANALQSPWGGITLYSDRARTPDSTFVHARFRGAGEAIVVTDGEPRFERCAFDTCHVGVAAGRMWNARSEMTETIGRPRPVVAECVFTRCRVGIFVESSAAPGVSRSSFVENRIGIGNDRMSKYSYPITGLGARVDRCWFAANTTSIEGPSVVDNSLFVRNSTVFRTTDFHSTYSQSTDRIAWRRNAFFDNICVTDGEADVGAENRVVDPQVRVAAFRLPPFEALVVPVPGLELAPDSLVRGTATDGGDPGPSGRSANGRRNRPWASANRALRTVLVLGPPDRIDAKKLPKSAPAKAGERHGDAWWAVFDTDEQGGLARSVLRWPEKPDTAPLAFVWEGAGGAAPDEIEINVDGSVALWRAGAALPCPTTPLRNGSRGERVRLPSAGPPGVVVWWRSADMDPRIGVAVSLPDGGRVSDLPETDPPAQLVADPIQFGPKHVGFRIATPFHWADLRTPGVFVLRAADGTEHDLSASGLVSFDAKGTVRADLPQGVTKAGATVRISGLRDVWGRRLDGQPREIDAEPVR